MTFSSPFLWLTFGEFQELLYFCGRETLLFYTPMNKITKYILSVVFGGFLLFVIVWMFIWAVIYPTSFEPYGVSQLGNTPFVVLHESQTTSRLCRVVNQCGYKDVIDDCPLKEVFWNDSVVIAKYQSRTWVKNDVQYHYYILHYQEGLEDKVEGPYKTESFEENIKRRSIELKDYKHNVW